MPMSVRAFAAKEGWFRVGVGGQVEGVPELTIPPGIEPTVEGMQFAALQLNNQLLAAILQELQETSPEGVVVSITQPVAVGAPIEVSWGVRLFNITLINDGANAIQYRLPNRGSANWVQLNPTEVITFNFIKGRIDTVGLQLVGAVGAAMVRMVGSY